MASVFDVLSVLDVLADGPTAHVGLGPYRRS